MKLISLLSIYLFLISNAFSNELPTAPEVVFPENGATAVYPGINYLQWKISTDIDGDEVQYDLYFGTSPNPPLYRKNLYDFWVNEDYTQYAVIVNDATLEFYSESGLAAPETTYYWRIVARDSQGGQTSSEVLHFTTARENTLPTKPKILFPSNEAKGIPKDVTVSWQASTDVDGDPVTYNVYLGSVSNNLQLIATGLTETAFDLTGLEDQRSYILRVASVDGYNGHLAMSDLSFFSVENYHNDAPAVAALFAPFDGTKNVTTKPTLQWQPATDKDGDKVTYDLYLGKEPNPTTKFASGLRETKFRVMVDDPYTTYFWKVVANDGKGGSTPSPVFSFIPWIAPQTPFSIEMVNVDGGDFGMGSPDFEMIVPGFENYGPQPLTNLCPQHTVTLDDYSIGKYEITYKQFLVFLESIQDSWRIGAGTNQLIFTDSNFVEVVMGVPLFRMEYPLCTVKAGSSEFDFTKDSKLLWDGTKLSVKEGFENYPVNWIYYKGAELFADWAGKELPTEAEWEFAALGGKQSHNYRYSGSDKANDSGWFLWNGRNPDNPMTGYGAGNPARDGVGTHEVGKKVPNELGVYDMSGNVREPCKDYYNENYYQQADNFNPLGPVSGSSFVSRGGGWDDIEYRTMVKEREKGFWYGKTGIRVVGYHSENTSVLVHGIIRDEEGNALQGVSVNSVSGRATTDKNGRYVFRFQQASAASITPKLDGYTFSPASIQVNSLKGKTTDNNFTAYLNRDYVISGTVKDVDGKPVQNVRIYGLPGSVITDADGFYSVKVPHGKSFTLTSELVGYSFNSSKIEITNIQSDRLNVDFTAQYLGKVRIYGQVLDQVGGIQNGVQISGFPGSPVITYSNGNYSKEVTKGWSGVLMPLDSEALFTPKQVVITDVREDLAQNFEIYSPGSGGLRTFTGIVKDHSNKPVEGVEILGFNKKVVTNVRGEFGIPLVPGWEGVISPVFKGYTFTPTGEKIVIPPYNDNMPHPEFIINPPGDYLVKGKVKDADGNALQGVALNGFPTEVRTDIQGNYSVWVIEGYSGTIYPKLEEYQFSPASVAISNISSHLQDQDFTESTSTTYTIAGTVTDGSGNALQGVEMQGFPTNVTTDVNGSYSTIVTGGWSGTVKPKLDGYAFNPTQYEFTTITADVSQHFTASPEQQENYFISGTITDKEGHQVEGVVLQGFPFEVTTDRNGRYIAAEVPPGWSGTVTPSKENYTFNPSSVKILDVQANFSEQDFVATYTGNFTLSGQITDQMGNPMINVPLEGLSVVVQTDQEGKYAVSIPAFWSGTITPKLNNYSFTPAAIEVASIQEDEIGQDFTATYTGKYRVSGQVLDISGKALAGVKMEGFPDMVQTDEQGNYVAEVPSGWSGTVTPFKGNFTFEPENVFFDKVHATVEGKSFVASPLISGLNKEEATFIQIYPNPTDGMVEMKFSHPIKKTGLLIISSMDGKIIQEYELKTGTTKINWQGNSQTGISIGPGIFVVRLFLNNEMMAVEKIIVME